MPINKGPITQGTDYNYWNRVSGITNTTFNNEAEVFFRFKGASKHIILTLEGATTVKYSFNGNTTHGELITSTDRSQVIFNSRPVSKIWFKVDGGTGQVTVEAWASPNS